MNLVKYRDGRWVEGGRAWPEVDCYGLVLEVRRDLGLPALPEWGNVRRGETMQAAVGEFVDNQSRCEPEPGAVAICYQGSLAVHVAIVVRVDGQLQVLEINEGRGVTLLPLPRFMRRFVRVEFYR